MVLLLGAVPTLIYPLLFTNKHAWVQVAIVGSLMMIVMLGLLVLVSLLWNPLFPVAEMRPATFYGHSAEPHSAAGRIGLSAQEYWRRSRQRIAGRT